MCMYFYIYKEYSYQNRVEGNKVISMIFSGVRIKENVFIFQVFL